MRIRDSDVRASRVRSGAQSRAPGKVAARLALETGHSGPTFQSCARAERVIPDAVRVRQAVAIGRINDFWLIM